MKNINCCLILIGFSILFFSGCASVPPPQLKSGVVMQPPSEVTPQEAKFLGHHIGMWYGKKGDVSTSLTVVRMAPTIEVVYTYDGVPHYTSGVVPPGVMDDNPIVSAYLLGTGDKKQLVIFFKKKAKISYAVKENGNLHAIFNDDAETNLSKAKEVAQQ